MSSKYYTPAYKLMLEANECWKNDNTIGDEKFLQACTLMYKHCVEGIWYRTRSPVQGLVQDSIDSCFNEKVKELHAKTEFGLRGFHYE